MALDRKKADRLFPELRPGGSDDKYSASAVKAFTRYRRKCGVSDGADFHLYRRAAITALEQNGAGQAVIARHVGHRVGTMAADEYSAGASRAQALGTAARLLDMPEVEAVVVNCMVEGKTCLHF